MAWHKNALNIICLVWPVCSWQLPSSLATRWECICPNSLMDSHRSGSCTWLWRRPRNAWSQLRDLGGGGGSGITRTMVTDSGNNVSWVVRVLQFLDSLRISRHVLVVQFYWASEARHILLVPIVYWLSNRACCTSSNSRWDNFFGMDQVRQHYYTGHH